MAEFRKDERDIGARAKVGPPVRNQGGLSVRKASPRPSTQSKRGGRPVGIPTPTAAITKAPGGNSIRPTNKPNRSAKDRRVDSAADLGNVSNGTKRKVGPPKRDPRVVGTAGDSNVPDARKNLEAAKKSGDQEFIAAATNRLRNTEKRAGRQSGQPTAAPEKENDAVVGDTTRTTDVAEALAERQADGDQTPSQVGPPLPQDQEQADEQLAQQEAQQGAQQDAQQAGEAKGGAKAGAGVGVPTGPPLDVNGNVLDVGTKVGIQPGGVPKQQVPGVLQKKEFTVERPMSASEIQNGPAGIYNTPNGQVERKDDGTLRITGLSERGKKRLKQLTKATEREFGDWSGKSDPNAPRPPLLPGMPSFNPDTGQWVGIIGDSILDEFGD